MTPEMKRLDHLLQVAANVPGTVAGERAGALALELIEDAGVRAVGGHDVTWMLPKGLPTELRRRLFRAKWDARQRACTLHDHRRAG